MLVGCALLPAGAGAHPGGLDASGCHTNRKTGEHHCHRAGTAHRADPPTPRSFRTSDSGAYYANCAAARAAGVAPLKAGDPGYRPGLDRDGDGRACE